MQTIQMVDLKSQYEKIKSQVNESVQEVIESGAFINGPAVKNFETSLATYLGAKTVVGCGNGTDALQIALMALELKPGDEVITTPFTFVATAEVIELLGLKAVFVDIDPHTFNLNPDLLEAAITPKTKCILPVHLFGQSADMEAILRIAGKHNLWVVEDNAQAIGGKYRMADGREMMTGTMGHVGCLSFYPSKNLGCYGDGGAVHANDENTIAKLRTIANHGSNRRYYYDSIGVNSRLDSIQAAILNIKLPLLDGYIDARRALADKYNQLLADVPQLTLPVVADNCYHVYHQYTLRVASGRDELQQYLNERGVPSMVYYPLPLHMHKPYQHQVNAVGKFPEAEQAALEVLSLPMHTEMDDEQVAYIMEQIKNFFNKQ